MFALPLFRFYLAVNTLRLATTLEVGTVLIGLQPIGKERYVAHHKIGTATAVPILVLAFFLKEEH